MKKYHKYIIIIVPIILIFIILNNVRDFFTKKII